MRLNGDFDDFIYGSDVFLFEKNFFNNHNTSIQLLKNGAILLNKIIEFLVFTNLPIKKKFLLFFLGTFFWFILVSAIGLVTMFEMNAKSQRIVDVIEPHQRTGHILIRKLRGISISVHKMMIVKEGEKVNSNLLKAKSRIEDSRSYLNTLLSGGRIKDYSRGTGQFYSEYNVVELKDSQKRKQIEDVKERIEILDKLIDDFAERRINNEKSEILYEMLSEIDISIRDTIAIVNDYIVSLDKEWQTFSNIIKTRLALSIILTIAVLLISAILSTVFGIIIARSLSRPVKALTEQIKVLSAGEIDLTKQLEVTSHDEIGDLTKEFNKLMETINNVTNFKKVVEEDESLQDIYFRLGKIFIEYLKIEGCVIYEVADNSSTMRVVFPPEAEGVELNCNKDIFLDCGLCRAKRTGHIVTSIDFPNICKYYLESPEKSHICLPIIVGGVVSGVVQIICRVSESCTIADIKNKINRAEQYIREVQPVLEAKKLLKALHESSIKDALTGLYNRRFLEETFEKLSAGAIRRGSILGLLMCDLDYFKQVNDTYGHDAGDALLKATANHIKETLRMSDIVIRFGGEEFLVIIMDTKTGYSVTIAEKIREKISAMKVQIRTESLSKTISIGVSEFPIDTENFWEAIKYADVALYKAKESGRNRVVRFDVSMWNEEKY